MKRNLSSVDPNSVALVLCMFKEGTGRQRGERHRELKGGGA
jgi:hypothetical protein